MVRPASRINAPALSSRPECRPVVGKCSRRLVSGVAICVAMGWGIPGACDDEAAGSTRVPTGPGGPGTSSASMAPSIPGEHLRGLGRICHAAHGSGVDPRRSRRRRPGGLDAPRWARDAIGAWEARGIAGSVERQGAEASPASARPRAWGADGAWRASRLILASRAHRGSLDLHILAGCAPGAIGARASPSPTCESVASSVERLVANISRRIGGPGGIGRRNGRGAAESPRWARPERRMAADEGRRRGARTGLGIPCPSAGAGGRVPSRTGAVSP